MTAKEAHQAQWQKLKDEPLQAKLKYIFTYYWAAIFGIVFAIIFVVSWLVFALTQKEAVLAGYLLNSTTQSSYQGSIAEEFLQDQEIDTDKYTFDLTSDSYYLDAETYVLENIITRMGAQDLDFIVTDIYTYTMFTAHLADLETILTAEQLEKYRPYFVYVEQSALDELTNSDAAVGIKLPEYYLESTDLEDPVAMGIRIPDSSRLLDAYSFPMENVIFGIPVSCQRLSMTLEFLDFILQE
ncbi:MAG: hypothetical protein E7455_00765 [Ruminococcaceae bacterium]|nr:hypothetical protein [Oscillospiraceae bacterium]